MPVATDEGLEVEDLADAAGANGIANEGVVGIEATILKDRKRQSPASGKLDECVTFARRKRHGLLHHDMLSVLERRHGPVGVAVRWGRDDHDIHAGVVDQCMGVVVHAHVRVGRARKGGASGVAIADGRQMQARRLPHGCRVCCADGAET